ncbi:hypothetical protein CEXT_794411 [Caerostris extrusa]|uniref:Uncharacterized protein n=1 Tax=Caerostris extrusa TaxID=172846 RepID=A0AAV4Y2H3_CAEEX|nr:hypothetical protein CEXT_794411 [Caerostris extrusa]
MSCESFVNASLHAIWRSEVKENAAMCRLFLLLRHDSIGYFVISSVNDKEEKKESSARKNCKKKHGMRPLRNFRKNSISNQIQQNSTKVLF